MRVVDRTFAFAYRRISGDASNRSNGENITILVTVK
jgi:hypothetical protein